MVAALALGQVLCWAALYYGFSSFVLPMQRELGWSKADADGRVQRSGWRPGARPPTPSARRSTAATAAR